MGHVPQVPPLAGMTQLGLSERTPAGDQHVIPGAGRDQAGLARRLAAEPLKPRADQKPCDVGLFSDVAAQTDLIERARAK